MNRGLGTCEGRCAVGVSIALRHGDSTVSGVCKYGDVLRGFGRSWIRRVMMGWKERGGYSRCNEESVRFVWADKSEIVYESAAGV